MCTTGSEWWNESAFRGTKIKSFLLFQCADYSIGWLRMTRNTDYSASLNIRRCLFLFELRLIFSVSFVFYLSACAHDDGNRKAIEKLEPTKRSREKKYNALHFTHIHTFTNEGTLCSVTLTMRFYRLFVSYEHKAIAFLFSLHLILCIWIHLNVTLVHVFCIIWEQNKRFNIHFLKEKIRWNRIAFSFELTRFFSQQILHTFGLPKKTATIREKIRQITTKIEINTKSWSLNVMCIQQQNGKHTAPLKKNTKEIKKKMWKTEPNL